MRSELYREGEAAFGSIYGDEEHEAMFRITNRLCAQKSPYVASEQIGFEDELSNLVHIDYGRCVASGGIALDIVLGFLNLQPEDETISCSLNFPGSHLAVIRTGSRLILGEAENEGLNLSPEEVSRLISPRTKAILITHMNGMAADISGIAEMAIVRSREIGIRVPKIIHDNARSLGASHQGVLVGGHSWATILSFHRKKTISTLGEGGMVLTNDGDLANYVADMRSFGRGEKMGSSFKMTEVQAGVGREQLKRLPDLISARRRIVGRRATQFRELGLDNILTTIRRKGDAPYLHNLLVAPSYFDRVEKLRRSLLDMGVGSVVANEPTYMTHPLIAAHVGGHNTPKSEGIASRLICLPLHPSMQEDDETMFTTLVGKLLLSHR